MTYAEYGSQTVTCPHCASPNVRRRINRVRIAKSMDSRLDSISDPSSLEGLEDDPRSLGRMMRKMSSEVGEEMGPEFNEVIDRLESGQSPEDIEAALPDLGLGDGPAGMDYGGDDDV
jgi:hypothetical protein